MRVVVGLLVVAALSGGCGRSIFEAGLPGDDPDAGELIGADGPRRDIGPDSGRDVGPDRDIGLDRDGGPQRPDRPDIGPTPCGQDCSFLDDLCVRGVCDPNVGVCVPRPVGNGTRCDDGDPCSLGDVCSNAVCVGRPLDCSFLDGVCQVGICDVNNPGSCVAQIARNGTPCEDGLMCTAGDICIQGMCSSGLATGGCSAPSDIPLVVGTQNLAAPASCAADDVRSSCGRRSSADAVWSFLSDGPRLLQVTAPSPGRNSSLVFQSSCGDPGTESACAAPAGNSMTIQQLVPAGQTIIAVDPGGAMFPGNVSALQVTIDPHDRCGGAVSLVAPPVGVTLEAAGMTVGADDDFQACGGAGAPDHVYRLTVQQPSLIDFSLVVPPNGNFYDSMLYLLPAPCTPGAGMFLACDDDSNGNNQPRFSTTLQPGNYFLVVDGFGTNSGEYALRITTRPTMATFVFPDFADARLQQVAGMYSQDGDFVEGARRPPLMSVGNATINLEVANNLVCDVLDLAVSINGTVVGTTTIFPGQINLGLNLAFPPLAGPNYSLRYEVLRDVAPGCGGIDLPLGISTVTLGP